MSPYETLANDAVEMRGLWVTRFDWTNGVAPAKPAALTEIVETAARAGFNSLFFQVRAMADVYYPSEWEPWAQRMSGKRLGQPPEPFWDPLETLIEKARAANLQVHAYMNVYPVAEGADQCNTILDPDVVPTPLYHQLIDVHGGTPARPHALQWSNDGQVICGSYRYATPASRFYEEHLVQVATELASNYAIDGLHLDHVRYAGRAGSCDPVSLWRYHGLPAGYSHLPPCTLDAAYADWQRQLIDNTVRRLYNEVALLRPNRSAERSRRSLWLTAAVWPIHTKKPSLGLRSPASQGYHDYYQDSKAWIQGGYIDALLPMIYPNIYRCPDNSFWTRDVWRTLVADFQSDGGGRYIVPGIGAGYCTFDEIAHRIDAARDLGVAGHALFSYRSLQQKGYFDALARGPYAAPALPPALPWRAV